jgi:hypothetical protein
MNENSVSIYGWITEKFDAFSPQQDTKDGPKSSHLF